MDKRSLILLINGYLKEQETELDLFMNIPDGIDKIMQKLYPLLLFKFGDFKKNKFQVTNNRTIIQGNGKGCWGYLIYADLGHYNDIGLNKGVHIWSIKLLSGGYSYGNRGATCFKSIGVTTEKSQELIDKFERHGDKQHWIEDGYNSFYKGNFHWQPQSVVTVKLNCNEWTVTYYNNNKQFQMDKIEANKYYYFAMMCCDKQRFTKVQVVENPTIF